MSSLPSYFFSVPMLNLDPMQRGAGPYNPYFASSGGSSSSQPSNGIIDIHVHGNYNDNENSLKIANTSQSDFVDLSIEQKGQVVNHIVRANPTVPQLRHLANFHVNLNTYKAGHHSKNKIELVSDFLHHRCTPVCLVRRIDAIAAGVHVVTPLSQSAFYTSIDVLQLRNTVSLKRKNTNDGTSLSKKGRFDVVDTSSSIGPLERDRTNNEWPTLLSKSEKLDILQESFDAGKNAAIKSVECSFCGIAENAGDAIFIPCADLDISLLSDAITLLRQRQCQPFMDAFRKSTISSDCYCLCTLCHREIRNIKDGNTLYKKEFFRLPLRSYANGTWVGDVPPELSDLTFLEEQCIARARATRCMFKLELGPSGQFASRGNVCVFPQDPGPLERCLPPPLSQIQDEVCVVLVGSPNTEITIDMLSKTPLLVRRNKIISALRWLKANNPLYKDLDMDRVEINAADYPESGIPIPIQSIIRTESNGEGSTYTEQVEPHNDTVSTAGMPSSTVIDADNVESTYKTRKLQALHRLRTGLDPFIKFPSGSTPMSTRKNPALYAYLWPTLFPYGVGMMENVQERRNESIAFRSIDMSKHISYLLSSLPNRRFQTHLSFLFVMGNILQRRQSSYSAKLAVKRSWFSRVDSLLTKVTADTITNYTQKLEKNPFARPEDEGEKAASQLIRYVNYIGDHIPGSMAEVQNLRDELFSIVHTNGLPHVFLTLNPSDTNNPIAQVLAGRDLDLNKIFDELKPGSENLERSRFIAQNPVAGARFFDLSVRNLVDILLGTRRSDRRGVFGKVAVYYGVVEAQGRGSLHIHMLLWLENGLSPKEIEERRASSPEWERKLTEWYDNVFSQNLPEGTTDYIREEGTYKRHPIMSRPQDPSSGDYWVGFNQDLRNILDNAGMIHEHNATCFKHLPLKLRALRNDDQDCRFQLPRDTIQNTHFDDEGYLNLRSNNGYVNGHNPLITVAQRCNMDAKPIGSGTVAMAMFQYFGNYTAKHTMDTAFVFSALCSAIKVLSDDPPTDIDGNIDTSERSRLLLLKTVNKMIGKRELSGQQVASKLIHVPSCYTNRKYPVFYWSGLLREIAHDVFVVEQAGSNEDEENISTEGGQPNLQLEDAAESESYVVLTQEMLAGERMSNNSPPSSTHNALFNDIFFRPTELESMCAWDIFCYYSKEKIPDSKEPHKLYLRFKAEHPQYATHCLKQVETGSDKMRVPVLKGYPIPRNDRVDQHLKYIVTMMTLFKPWSNNVASPIKDVICSWESAFGVWEKSPSFTDHLTIMTNMQLLYETKDAKLDYSAMRRKRRYQLVSQYNAAVNTEDDEYDPAWEHAMMTPVDTDLSEQELEGLSDDLPLEILTIVDSTTLHGFYDTSLRAVYNISTDFSKCASLATESDYDDVNNFQKSLARCKDAMLNRRVEAMNQALTRQKQQPYCSDAVPIPFTTNIQAEIERAHQLYLRGRKDDICWNTLEAYQQLAIALIEKHHLNCQQILAFLLLVDTVAKQWKGHRDIQPLHMLVTGPGGSGKSRLFEAWHEFHLEHDRAHEFRLTAPTGVVASDIGGSTIHSEASLRVSRKTMTANDKKGQTIRDALESRFAPMRTLVVDEIYFMSPSNISTLSEYCCLAKGNTQHPFGGLNLVTCGDPAQLPPPLDKPLFDRQLVHCYETNHLNALNTETQFNVKGIQAWHQVNNVVVLNKIMRQKDDPLLLDILGRLRTGTCTVADKATLDCYVLGNDNCSSETSKLPSIEHWVTEPSRACPLITYTNLARDAHNSRSAKAFALATGQDFHLYHSTDTRGRGQSKRALKGIAAEAAWRVPVKSAKDLGGKIPLIPGIPVFGTENMATELGLSNGSRGTLVSVCYEVRDSIRYAISATVDFPGFNGPDTAHPHRAVLKPVEQSFKFSLPNSDTIYSATRSQLPLIPAFAFTSHNSQGRSLDVACIDLAGCRSIQSAYVMLSRVRSLKGLCILRPFQLNKIQNHISEELREEMRRTKQLAVKTTQSAKDKLTWYYSLFPQHVPS